MMGQARRPVMTPLLLALLGVACVLLLLYASLQRDLRRAVQANDAILHAVEVREALGNILALHVEVEDGKRGYVIAGDSRFRAPYTDSINRIGPALQQLAALEARDKSDDGKAHLVAAESAKHLAYSREVVAMVDEGRNGEARDLIAAGRGAAAMGRIRKLIADLQSDQQAQLQRHSTDVAAIRSAISNTLDFMLISLGMLVVGGGFASIQIIRSQANRIESDSNLFNAVVDPIILLNRTGVILSSNLAAQRQFGYSEQELTGTSVAVLLAEWPTDKRLAEGLRTIIKQHRQTGLVRDYRFRRRNGTRFKGNVSLSVGEAADGTTLAAIIRPHLVIDQLVHPATTDEPAKHRSPEQSGIDLLDKIRARVDAPSPRGSPHQEQGDT
jgi:PAS domain S-box-containing protein